MMWGAVILTMLGLMTPVYGNVIAFTSTIPHAVIEEFRDLPAQFGPELSADGVRGLLVEGAPKDGCDIMDKPPTSDNFTGKWIVLVARYNCSFEMKVRNAQAAGFDCVIVHNVNSSDLENMSAKNDTGITIPAVFVSDFAGETLAANYLYDKGYYIMVNGELPFNINTHLLLPFAIVVLLCLLIILIFMIVKCIKDRNRARRHRLSNRALDKIPTCKFSKGDPYETCAICLDDYQEGEKLRVLPCAHAYHSSCIDPWLTQNKRVCPVCKRKVFAAGERRRRIDSDSSESDTEPLLPAQPVRPTGGTFEEQNENPFRRAARFMSRLQAGNNAQESTSSGGNDPGNEIHIESGVREDQWRLMPAAARLREVSERRGRRGRRARRTRSAEAQRSARQTPPASPVLNSDAHSINGNTRGEIGVAALPAPRQPPSSHHVNL